MPSSLGPAEILVILVVALIVLGPKRLPEAGRQVGKALSEMRRWSRDIQGEVRGAFDVNEVRPAPPKTTTAPPAASSGPEGAGGPPQVGPTDEAPPARDDEPPA